MDGIIIGEDDKDIGTKITDREGSTHQIEIHKSNGEIYAHEQEAYPDDPSKRTCKEDESVSQARRYARYYVRQERGYETVPWTLDPERFEVVKDLLAGLSKQQVDEAFGEYYRQLAGHQVESVTPPNELPEGVDADEFIMYKMDLYLDETNALEATSGIHMMYYAGVNDDRTVWADDPITDRDPDARLEHVPVSFNRGVFGEFLVYHLKCQIRDCYIGMGLEPPAEYRVLGPGLNKFTLKYSHFDMYPRYHDYTADIAGYDAKDYFNSGPFMSKIRSLL